MERVQVLIDKLIQQRQQNESAAQMLLTVQLLQNELMQLQQNNKTAGSKKVAVVMPAANTFAMREEAAAFQKDAYQPVPVTMPEPVQDVKQEPTVPKVTETPKAVEVPKAAEPQKDLFGEEAYTLKRPQVTIREEIQPEPQAEEKTFVELKPVEPEYHHPFDVMAETPTLLHHTTQKDINQSISDLQQSLNDRLKQDKTELAHVLKDTPVKDLRKAIGINDKFLFVDELFRGDDAMYERSIKTINGFHILQEAEYWINRELKVKLGWNDSKDTVQHFYQLVRRRFS